MSITRTETQAPAQAHADETAAYGGLADAVGGIATVVLAVVGLAHAEVELAVNVTHLEAARFASA